MLAVERVAAEDVSSYGIVAVDESESLGRGVYRVKDLVEKPRREDAPSNLAIIGRYILTPDIFEALAATVSDRTGEIQLTNGLRRLLQKRPIYVCEIDGVRHDTGNKLGFLKALVYFALRRPELAEPFRRYLETLELKIGDRNLVLRGAAARRRGPRRWTTRRLADESLFGVSTLRPVFVDALSDCVGSDLASGVLLASLSLPSPLPPSPLPPSPFFA